jgi:hypothetical protein
LIAPFVADRKVYARHPAKKMNFFRQKLCKSE